MSQEVIESLISQLEASKQMYNEALNNLYQVRTHNVTLQRQMSAINNRLAELEKAQADEVSALANAQEVSCDAPSVAAPEVCEDYSDKSPETDAA